MLCQRCRKRGAQFHSTRIIDNQLVDIHLCRICAENSNNQDYANNIEALLEVLINTNVYNKGDADVPRCDSCGTTLPELQKNRLAGCPGCYSVFSEYIFKDKVKAYRRKTSGGKGPDIIERLEKRLNRAVESEDFEEAAHIRDKIRDLEKEGFFGDN